MTYRQGNWPWYWELCGEDTMKTIKHTTVVEKDPRMTIELVKRIQVKCVSIHPLMRNSFHKLMMDTYFQLEDRDIASSIPTFAYSACPIKSLLYSCFNSFLTPIPRGDPCVLVPRLVTWSSGTDYPSTFSCTQNAIVYESIRKWAITT